MPTILDLLKTKENELKNIKTTCRFQSKATHSAGDPSFVGYVNYEKIHFSGELQVNEIPRLIKWLELLIRNDNYDQY